jgi:hypothetical protein
MDYGEGGGGYDNRGGEEWPKEKWKEEEGKVVDDDFG